MNIDLREHLREWHRWEQDFINGCEDADLAHQHNEAHLQERLQDPGHHLYDIVYPHPPPALWPHRFWVDA